MRRLTLSGILVCLAAAASPHQPRPSRYSWWRDVRPIVHARCAACHAPGGAGPMSLLRYEDVLPWAAAMQRETLERRMPPWAPEEGHVAYRGERQLSAREIDVLADWIIGATPEGDPEPGDEPARPGPRFSADAALTLRPEAVTLGPDEPMKVACRVVTLPTSEPTWVTGIEIIPSAPRSLRRATVWSGEDCEEDAPPLLVWVPGQAALELAQGSAETLAAAQPLAVRLEYLKAWDDDGFEVVDQTELRLRRGTGSGRPVLRRDADAAPLEWAATLIALLPVDIDDVVLDVMVERPDHEPLVVLELREPDPLWLARYELAEPLHLPAGSIVRASGGRVSLELVPEL